MFTDIHLLDATRLMTLGQPVPYIFLAIPLLYLFTLAPATCPSGPPTDLLTSNKLPSNKLLPPPNPRLDPRLLLGILAGTFVLAQSTLADTLYLTASLIYSALSHHPL
jgi:hypothetical protein